MSRWEVIDDLVNDAAGEVEAGRHADDGGVAEARRCPHCSVTDQPCTEICGVILFLLR